VLLQLHWIGQYGTKKTNLHIEKPNLLEVFLSKTTKFSQGNNMLDAAGSNIDCFLGEIRMFFNSLQWDYLEEMTISET
jgi:hypothetical protein